ncbi:MAG TPA: gluconate 2-dehydrogenase subunit 3 family protein [Terriglobia bacterium]|nr:gluconate 2-dehydrogenase subunit 3 family protein [Terriglobia bacterium]
MAEGLIGRRQTLKYFGVLTGTVAGQHFLASWLPAGFAAENAGSAPAMHHIEQSPAAQSDDAAPYSPRFFKPDEFKTVEVLTELIVPTDDGPGAKEAKVARYIDFVVSAAAELKPALQLEWTQGVQLLDRLSREKYKGPFREISAADQEALLTAMSLPEREPGSSHPGFAFYSLVKDMTVEGFYTSRVGLIDVLGYQGLAILSEFPGCTHPEHQM